MTIIAARIHPAIGIARVGDSDSEPFIGPEIPGDPAFPQGIDYRGTDHRIRRQAARFRVFGYHDDGRVEELTAATADIRWTVHLVNRKAVGRRLGARGNGPGTERNSAHRAAAERAKLVIDPGPHSVEGSNRRPVRLDGDFVVPHHPEESKESVRLGEISTDADGHLVVAGGRGRAGSPSGHKFNDAGDSDEWYDDVSDGPVSATVRMAGVTIDVEPARVIVGPPKFAPPVGNVVRLWDVVFEALADDAAKFARPSYVRDIYPILQAARDVGAVNGPARTRHRFTHPVRDTDTKDKILARIRATGPTHMPRLYGSKQGRLDLALTKTQKRRLESWAANDFDDDWPDGADSPPVDTAITPDGLDRAALENCVGGALEPGVEAGKVLVDPANYVGDFTVGGRHPSFRLRPDLPPGAVTEGMALPWQQDFHECQGWWPAVRPDRVVPDGAPPNESEEWLRGAEDPEQFARGCWAHLGFVLRRPDGELVERDRTL
ncbi:LodA/GoxA family CTQ-dependent oxidase [Amycolatopsis sp. NPDC005003]